MWVTVLPGRAARWLSHEAAIRHILSPAACWFPWPRAISLAIHTQAKLLSQALCLLQEVTGQILWTPNLPQLSGWLTRFCQTSGRKWECIPACVRMCAPAINSEVKSQWPHAHAKVKSEVHPCGRCTFTVSEVFLSSFCHPQIWHLNFRWMNPTPHPLCLKLHSSLVWARTVENNLLPWELIKTV